MTRAAPAADAALATSLVAAIAALPILWGLVTALKIARADSTYPRNGFRRRRACTSCCRPGRAPTSDLLRNSILVSAVTVVLSLISVRMRPMRSHDSGSAGQSLILVGLLATSMIPGIAILVRSMILQWQTASTNTFSD